jgi:hypothetical protein
VWKFLNVYFAENLPKIAGTMATRMVHQGFNSCMMGTTQPRSGRVGANLSGTLIKEGNPYKMDCCRNNGEELVTLKKYNFKFERFS